MGHEIRFSALVNAGLGIVAESFLEGQQAASSQAVGRAAWIELEEQLLDLFRQTKHVDMLWLLALAECQLHGIAGLRNGLDLANALLDRQWDQLHPQDSEADYEFRQDCLRKLDSPALVEALHPVVIADGRQLGKFTFGGWLDASREGGGEAQTIEQAMAETLKDQPSFYDDMAAMINEVNASADRLGLTVKDHFVSFRLPLTQLRAKLSQLAGLVARFTGVAITGTDADSSPQGGSDAARPAGATSLPDQINSREDVVKALEKLILYYTRNEPASPVPALLERAQRVATMNFREIVREFKLSATPSIHEVLGWQEDEENTF